MQGMRFSRQLRTGLFGALVMLLLVGLFSAARPAPTQAASLKITSFYTIARKSYDSWVATHKVFPSPLKRFKAGTKDVGYILEYTGAKPKVSTFQIIIYDGSGDVFSTGDVHKLSYKSGNFANYFYNDPSFPGGTYKMKLLLNGKAARNTSFFVGS
jgi:hypothetical protein